MPELALHLSGASRAATTRSLVSKYAVGGAERAVIAKVLGESGNLLWATRDGAIQLHERKWIVTMVSVESVREIDWNDV